MRKASSKNSAARPGDACFGARPDLPSHLESLGAPSNLVCRARCAVQDHARQRDAGRALSPYLARAPATARWLEGAAGRRAFALHNAREGCIRETWNAAVAAAQSRNAGEHSIRQFMVLVARDELLHSCLAWELAEWIAPQLSVEEREEVRAELWRAMEQLGVEVSQPVPEPLRRQLGWPSVDEAHALLGTLRAEVWYRAG